MFNIFKRDQAQPKQEPVAEPYVEDTTNNTTRDCRACTGGHGDGCCSYHSNHFRRGLQRWESVNSTKQGGR